MNNYTPVGDLIVSSVCLVMIVLLFFSYNRHTRSFRIFLALIGLLILAANTNVSFYMLVTTGAPRFYPLAYFLRWLYHGILFTILFFYVAYIIDVTRMEGREKRIAFSAAGGLWLIVVATDAVETITGTGIRITGQGVINRGMNLFLYGYLAFVLVIIILLINVRNNLCRNVMLSFYGTILMAFFVLFLQGECGQTSFTAASFLYPLIGMFYIMHSSPYDVQIGAVDSRAFEDMVRESLRKKSGFVYLSLYMRTINEGGKVPPEEMYSSIRAYATNSFKGGLLFQVGKGHSILVAQKEQNPDYKDRIRDAIDGFYDEYAKFRFDYKIAIELTESQTEDDFILMKDKIDQLKEREIKFDRSLLLASDSNERSRTIVSSLANMFARMKYSVLYEGVEREDEERMCIDMDASFLQGYKYSRPVPIEELDHFFEKAEWSLIL
ncbi:MAG: EAL domain-containing protein [Eubacterium sp.]|nr:EAL domain-containing protein [Eubacterium sp.]